MVMTRDGWVSEEIGNHCWIRCAKCPGQQWLAYGRTGYAMVRLIRHEVARKLGWRVAPVILCPKCNKKYGT
jgi:hypothetical protein